MSRALVVVVASVFFAFGLVRLDAQRGNPQPPRAPKAAAPIDLTGYWVSIVTQDWRWRMVTPRKGDYQGIPITPAAAKVVCPEIEREATTAQGSERRCATISARLGNSADELRAK